MQGQPQENTSIKHIYCTWWLYSRDPTIFNPTVSNNFWLPHACWPHSILNEHSLTEDIETPYSTGSSWRPPSMHCLLSFTFVTFLILWPLSPAASSVFWYRSCLVWSGLAYGIYSGGGPSTYVYCVVCYHVIVAPYVRSVGHVFAYLYTLDDDSEHPMYYETSLLPNVFPLHHLPDTWDL